MQQQTAPPRRRLLRHGLALLAGGIGLGQLVKAAPLSAGTATGQRDAPPRGGRTLTLYGTAWHQYGAGHRPGHTPSAGERLTTYGDLLSGPGGTVIGTFHGASFSTGSPFVSHAFATGSVEVHTFALTDGTIVGMGAATGDTAAFAIVGGTGRYVGATGSYVARQQPYDQGGDGSAVVTFTFAGAGSV